MQCSILVSTTSGPAKPFHVVLELCLHDAADCDNVATDARVDQVILDLTVNRLGHLSSVHVLEVIFDLLKSESLKELSPRRVLLWVKNARPTIQRDTPVGCLPLAIDEGEQYFALAVVTLELNRLNQHLDGADPKHSTAQANKLVDQV